MAENEKPLSVTVQSTKLLLSIIASLAISNCIAVFLTGGKYLKINSIKEICQNFIGSYSDNIYVYATLLFLFTLFFIFMYHREQNEYLADPHYSNINDKKWLYIDIIFIFFECILAAFLGFYIFDIESYAVTFILFITIDTLWTEVYRRWYPHNNDTSRYEEFEKKWRIIGWYTVIVYIIAISVIKMTNFTNLTAKFCVFFVIILANTILDYCWCWKFYFPPLTFHEHNETMTEKV